MQKMRELDFTKTRLSYNQLMNLYFQMGERKKLDNIVQEMEENGIGFDKFTYSIMLSVYANSSNLVEMKKLLMKLEVDPLIVMDLNLYAVATNGYIKAGQMDEALVIARTVEILSKVKTETEKTVYQFLLTLYARIGHKNDVYHVWDMLKKNGKIYNTTYLAMMSSLSILDDIDGIEKICEDWKANNTYYDPRVANFLVSAYCKKFFLEKAELLVNRLTECCNKPNASTWDQLATGYNRYGHMEKAVDTMKKAILASDSWYKPNIVTLKGCIDYLEGKGDDGVIEFRNLLEEHCHFYNDIRGQIEKHLILTVITGSSDDDHDQTLENGELLKSSGFENKNVS